MRKRKCRVCKVEKAASVLDETGRCKSCAMAKAATDAGMTYGKYTAMIRSRNREKQAQLEKRIKSERYEAVYCKRCGGIIPTKAKYEGFCCRECYLAFEQQEKDAKERGVFKKPREKVCLNCGAPLGGNKKYCSNRCKYLHNQDRINERNRIYRENQKEKKAHE